MCDLHRLPYQGKNLFIKPSYIILNPTAICKRRVHGKWLYFFSLLENAARVGCFFTQTPDIDAKFVKRTLTFV